MGMVMIESVHWNLEVEKKKKSEVLRFLQDYDG